MKLEDKDGIPWTAHLGVGWLVLIVALSSGVFAIALGIYLSLWMYQRGRSMLPLILFSLVAPLGLLLIFPPHLIPSDTIGTLASIVYLVAAFTLRRELQLDAKSQGFKRELTMISTLFFSTAYFNYYLNPLTFDHSPKKDPISLNLRK